MVMTAFGDKYHQEGTDMCTALYTPLKVKCDPKKSASSFKTLSRTGHAKRLYMGIMGETIVEVREATTKHASDSAFHIQQRSGSNGCVSRQGEFQGVLKTIGVSGNVVDKFRADDGTLEAKSHKVPFIDAKLTRKGGVLENGTSNPGSPMASRPNDQSREMGDDVLTVIDFVIHPDRERLAQK
ncbi:hypothetical protein GALMADRAFT_213137 [Galerina marginata CBS 339.88]|uniref:Uncharacterized protein n=1 Tax=Galerina marginata (strain CBS 339.88) TaxID=685588 RepID=A0A067SY39_GALM3|nr:hypothetical protein GALMADRAFT_213137 [Galerina marginata CBS 339.88]